MEFQVSLIMNSRLKPVVLVAGIYLNSPGYPNVFYRLQSLKNDDEYEVKEVNFPIWRDERQKKRVSLLGVFLYSYCVLKVVFVSLKYIVKGKVDFIYVPYPAVPVVFALRFFGVRKKIIADAFVSLFDTVVMDRGLFEKNSVAAKMIFYLEKMVFKWSNLVVVDTDLNKNFYVELFRLKERKFLVSPLFTDERPLDNKEDVFNLRNGNGVCQVLFVGNMVPLHGIEVIAGAILALKDNKSIQFTIIGDGQEAHKIEKVVQGKSNNVVWIKNWLNHDDVRRHILAADICLGIFSNKKKAERVCPYKLYLYLFLEKAVITGDTPWARCYLNGVCHLTQCGDALALAEGILMLANSEERRVNFAKSAKRFYCDELSNVKAGMAFDSSVERILCASS